MTMRARVEQLAIGVAGATDDWGNPEPATTLWELKIDALPCWFWTTAEREPTGPDSTKVVEDMRMIIPRGSAVKERDRINGVVDRLGNPIREGLLMIESVTNHRDHIELTLIGITSGA
jgi:hypothetical protein